MRITIPFLFILLMLYSCKKESPAPSQNGGANNPTTPATSMQIKSTRAIVYKNEEIVEILNGEMNYSSSGQLNTIKWVDSLKLGQFWSVEPLRDSMSYSTFNKVNYFITNRGDLGLIINYVFDSNNKLKKEARRNVWSDADTIRYTYSGKFVIGELHPSSGGITKSYYSLNLDSVVEYGASGPIIRHIYKRNSKVDYATAYQNQFYSVLSDVTELTQESIISYIGVTPYSHDFFYSRKYSSSGLPIEIRKSDGAENTYTVTQYSYY